MVLTSPSTLFDLDGERNAAKIFEADNLFTIYTHADRKYMANGNFVLRPLSILAILLAVVIFFGFSYATPAQGQTQRLSARNEDQDFTIFGGNLKDRTGSAIAAGDVNNDGIMDIIIGTSRADDPRNRVRESGEVNVIFGAASLANIDLDIAQLGGAADSTLLRPDIVAFGNVIGGSIGNAVSSGDINGDGIDDIIIGAVGLPGLDAKLKEVGRTFVIFGRSGFPGRQGGTNTSGGNPNHVDLSGVVDLTVFGQNRKDHSGCAVYAADIDGDTVDDLIIGASSADGPTRKQKNVGAVYIISSRRRPFGPFLRLPDDADIIIYGARRGDLAEIKLSSGHINDDDIDDLIIGAPLASYRPLHRRKQGCVYVLYGSTDIAAPPGEPNRVINLGDDTTFAPDELVTIVGARKRDNLGSAVAAGDINNNGRDDLLIAASGADGIDNIKRKDSGEAYVFFDSNPALAGPVIDLLGNNDMDLRFFGADKGDLLGTSAWVSNLGGDIGADIFLGAMRGDGPFNDTIDVGEAYVIFDPSLFRSISISSNGTRIAFASFADITGDNPDENIEIFLFDINNSTTPITQITNTTFGINTKPSISGDGTKIAFESTADLDPTVGNLDSSPEIFIADVTDPQTPAITQVTDTESSKNNHKPSINGDGTMIAFESDANLDPDADNSDGNIEIFLATETAPGVFSFTQITDTSEGTNPPANANPSMSMDAEKVAFESNANLSENNSDGNSEIFLFTDDSGSGKFTQITNTDGGGNFTPSPNGDSSRIAFESTSDITGNNADGNKEIFLFDSTTDIITQITDTTVGENTNPATNDDGTIVVFESTADLVPAVGNADGNKEIFLYNSNTRTITQITNTASATNANPSINSGGTLITFESDADLDPSVGNADGNKEIFVYNVSLAQFTQITNPPTESAITAGPDGIADTTADALSDDIQEIPEGTTGLDPGDIVVSPGPDGILQTVPDQDDVEIFSGDNTQPSISDDGTIIAFVSNSNLAGFANNDGNNEIFLYDGTISQVTDTTVGDSANPAVSGDGTMIAFQSTANVVGSNVGSNTEIFIYNIADNEFTEITDESINESINPSINSDGTKVAFESDANILGGNSDRNEEIFLHDVTLDETIQITDTKSVNNFEPSISNDGKKIAFRSTANLAPNNSDNSREIFVFNAATGRITQVTNIIPQGNDKVGVNENPSISADGAMVAFESTADITGGNSDGNREIFMFDGAADEIAQITDTISEDNERPSISGDGTVIVFDSTADITGDNSDKNREIFLFDSGNNANPITQITTTDFGDNRASAVNGDGTRIIFRSTNDLTGTNVDGNREIFIYDAAGFTQITDTNTFLQKNIDLKLDAGGNLPVPGTIIFGKRRFDKLGAGIAAADIDGDGVNEAITGAPGAAPPLPQPRKVDPRSGKKPFISQRKNGGEIYIFSKVGGEE